jgi:hypothetical protein
MLAEPVRPNEQNEDKREDAGMMQQEKEWREEKLVLKVEHEHYSTRGRSLIKAE